MFMLRRGLFGANHLTGIPEPIDMMSKQNGYICTFFIDIIMLNTNNIDNLQKLIGALASFFKTKNEDVLYRTVLPLSCVVIY